VPLKFPFLFIFVADLLPGITMRRAALFAKCGTDAGRSSGGELTAKLEPATRPV